MERVLGKVQQEFKGEDEECWVVSDGEIELMAFETLWRANEWRRTTKIYRSFTQTREGGYYMQKSGEWYVRAVTLRGWQKVGDNEWVERAVQESEAQYRRNMQDLS